MQFVFFIGLKSIASLFVIFHGYLHAVIHQTKVGLSVLLGGYNLVSGKVH